MTAAGPSTLRGRWRLTPLFATSALVVSATTSRPALAIRCSGEPASCRAAACGAFLDEAIDGRVVPANVQLTVSNGCRLPSGTYLPVFHIDGDSPISSGWSGGAVGSTSGDVEVYHWLGRTLPEGSSVSLTGQPSCGALLYYDGRSCFPEYVLVEDPTAEVSCFDEGLGRKVIARFQTSAPDLDPPPAPTLGFTCFDDESVAPTLVDVPNVHDVERIEIEVSDGTRWNDAQYAQVSSCLDAGTTAQVTLPRNAWYTANVRSFRARSIDRAGNYGPFSAPASVSCADVEGRIPVGERATAVGWTCDHATWPRIDDEEPEPEAELDVLAHDSEMVAPETSLPLERCTGQSGVALDPPAVGMPATDPTRTTMAPGVTSAGSAGAATSPASTTPQSAAPLTASPLAATPGATSSGGAATSMDAVRHGDAARSMAPAGCHVTQRRSVHRDAPLLVLLTLGAVVRFRGGRRGGRGLRGRHIGRR